MKTAVKRTNKEWNEIYFNYILECIPCSEDLKNEFGFNGTSDSEKIDFILKTFNAEHNYDKRQPLTQRIGEWFAGLPSVINIDYSYCEMIEIFKKWGVIDDNTSEKTTDKIIEGWFPFTAHYLLKLAKKHKLLFIFVLIFTGLKSLNCDSRVILKPCKQTKN